MKNQSFDHAGSILVFMIVVVALVSSLALLSGSFVVSRSRLTADARVRAELRNAACSGAAMAAWMIVSDTNGVDHLQEPWATDMMEDEAQVVVSDERARLPFPGSEPAALSALIVSVTGVELQTAADQAVRLHTWWDRARAASTNRVLAAEEELLFAPGSDPELLAAVLPHLRVLGGDVVNVNTVGGEVWTAMAIGTGVDIDTAEGLYMRLLQSRRRGEWFETLDPGEVLQRLTGNRQGLSAAELVALQRVAPRLCVESGVFRITATAERDGVRRAVQCIVERETGEIRRWLEF